MSGAPLRGVPRYPGCFPHVAIAGRAFGAPCWLMRATRSTVPAELLWLAGRALGDHDVDEGGAAEVHRTIEGAGQILRVLDKEALAAEGVHHPVIAGAVNQCVGLEVEHRVFRDLRHAGADAAIVQ